ncbi:MAG: LysO family transporter [Muribaculaceae bacterium]
MLTIILIMAMGLAAGYLLRRKHTAWLPRVVTAMVWLLLLLLGVEVGSNDAIIGNLHRLGLDALVIAALATIFSITASALLWHRMKSGYPTSNNGDKKTLSGIPASIEDIKNIASGVKDEKPTSECHEKGKEDVEQ